MDTPRDLVEDRVGDWMQTSLGGKFFPRDVRAEEIFISDIANGLAMDCRYAGQGRVDRFYSVAEHSVHIACHARYHLDWPARGALVALLHDAPEAFLRDRPRAVKLSERPGPADELDRAIENAVMERFGLTEVWERFRRPIKDLDVRMVPLEKQAIMRYPQPWAFDEYVPLEGVRIECWSPARAKLEFLTLYDDLCEAWGPQPQEWEL